MKLSEYIRTVGTHTHTQDAAEEDVLSAAAEWRKQRMLLMLWTEAESSPVQVLNQSRPGPSLDLFRLGPPDSALNLDWTLSRVQTQSRSTP